MIALRLAARSVLRRGRGLLVIVVPFGLLLGMLTLLTATEATVRQLLAPGLSARVFRIGSVEGMSYEVAFFSQAEIRSLAKIPGVEMAPAFWVDAYVDKSDRHLWFGLTTRTYIAIWDFSGSYTKEDVDRWDSLKNGLLVTRAVADKYHWKRGDLVTITLNNGSIKDPDFRYDSTQFVIAGIAEKYLTDMETYAHADYWEQHFNKTVKYWVVWMLVDSPEHRQAVMDQVGAMLDSVKRPYVLWPGEVTKQAIMSASAVLRDCFRIAGAFAFLLVLAGSTGLLILSIEQRSAELAALRAIGFRRAVLFRMIVAEGAFLLLPGAILGALAVWVPFHTTPLIFDPILRVRVTLPIALLGATGGVALGALAALVPAYRVYRTDILAALR